MRPARRAIAPLLLVLASLAAAPAATTAPSRDDLPGQRLERLLALDDLTADQRAQVQAIAADVRAEIDKARATTGPAASRTSIREAIERGRVRAIAVLTPSQRDRLRNANDAPTSRPAPPPVSSIVTPAPATTRAAAFGVGDRLPTFSLARVDGKPVTFESLVGKPSVLVFGSYSSPAFRDQLPRVADLAARYGSRVGFVVVYTREMFPTTQSVDQPERNQDAKIAIPAAVTDADRKASAKAMVDKLKLRLPVGLDAIDDRLTTALGAFPDAAIVADAKGVIVARWQWTDPFAIKRALDKLLAIK